MNKVKIGMLEKSKGIPRAALFLGWLGVLPFAFFSVASLTGAVVDPDSARDVLFIYGALILSFMGGVQWGLAAVQSGTEDEDAAKAASVRFAVSVLPALAAFALWALSLPLALVSLAAAFMALLAYDLKTVREGLAPKWYAPMRIQLSGAVVALLLTTAVFGGT